MASAAQPVKPRLHGLYVITEDRQPGAAALIAGVTSAVLGGARVVQYRDKTSDSTRRLHEATALAALCRDRGVLFLINDDVELAAASSAHGVHLGRDDPDLAAARRLLPERSLIGITCYDQFGRAQRAAAQGADYIAFGSFYASPTKPHAVRASPELLRRARRELSLPVVAIGGISPENGAALVRAGADMLAVVSAVFSAPDITVAAQAFARCFSPTEEINR